MWTAVLAVSLAAFGLPSSALAASEEPHETGHEEAVSIVLDDPEVQRRLRHYDQEDLTTSAHEPEHEEGVEVRVSNGDTRVLVALVRDGKVQAVRGSRGFDQDGAKYGGDLATSNVAIGVATLAFLLVCAMLRRVRRRWSDRVFALSVVGLACGHVLLREGHDAWIPLAWVSVALALVAFAFALAGRSGRGERRTPHRLPVMLLLPLLLVLLLVRGYVVQHDGTVIDVGYASAAGGQFIAEGLRPWGNMAPTPLFERGDTYGPVVYLAYLPAAEIQGFGNSLRPVAQWTAIVVDALCCLALVLVGRRRLGSWGPALLLGLAWATCYETFYTMANASNDALVALAVLACLAVLWNPWLRGAVLSAAVATKFAPLVAFPAIMRSVGRKAPRDDFVRVLIAALLLWVPFVAYLASEEGGLRQFWEASVGFQLSRGAHNAVSVWAWYGLDPLRWAGVAALLALLVWQLKRAPRSFAHVAARVAMALLAVQLLGTNWWFPYTLWALPAGLIWLASSDDDEPAAT